MAARLTEADRIRIRLAIEDLNNAFTHHLDHGNVEALVDLFTEDAIYTHGDRRSVGRDEIAALFEARSAAGPRTARHLQTGLTVEIESSTAARGTSVCLTFAANGLPPLTATPHLVADFDDVYALTDRWRFRERHISRVFVAADNPGPIGGTGR